MQASSDKAAPHSDGEDVQDARGTEFRGPVPSSETVASIHCQPYVYLLWSEIYLTCAEGCHAIPDGALHRAGAGEQTVGRQKRTYERKEYEERQRGR